MSEAHFIIPTRQKADLLYSSSELTPAGQALTLPRRLILGYASLRVFAFSDQPFTASGEGSCSEDGPLGDLEPVPSVLDPVTGLNFFCAVIQLCNPYVEPVFTNVSGFDQTIFSLCIYGLPLR